MQDPRAWLEALRTRVLLMLVRGLVRRTRYAQGDEESGTKGFVQLLQVEGLSGEVLSDVEHLQPYGFASRVEQDEGAEYFGASLGGDRTRTVVLVAFDRKKGVKLKPGEVAIFDGQGQEIRLREDGTIRVKSTGEVQVAAPKLRMLNAGEIETAGSITGGQVGDQHPTTPTLQSMRLAYNAHTHPGDGTPVPQM